jgi:hypothetical protein
MRHVAVLLRERLITILGKYYCSPFTGLSGAGETLHVKLYAWFDCVC